MLDSEYLVLGLDALSRASGDDYFRDGHFGASVIAAYFLCRENGLDAGTQAAIQAIVDRELRPEPAFRATPAEEPDDSLIADVLATLSVGISDLREVGHNVIFGAAALEAFRQVPRSITPFRTSGVCSLLASFRTTRNVAVGEADGVPGTDDPGAFAEFVCREFVDTVERYAGRGQGWSGHLLTFGHALLTLAALGHHALARGAHQAYRMYVTTVRGGPRDTDPRIPDHPRSDLTPLDRSYWERRRSVRGGLGHAFKYARSFYALLRELPDPALKERFLAEGHKLF